MVLCSGNLRPLDCFGDGQLPGRSGITATSHLPSATHTPCRGHNRTSSPFPPQRRLHESPRHHVLPLRVCREWQPRRGSTAPNLCSHSNWWCCGGVSSVASLSAVTSWTPGGTLPRTCHHTARREERGHGKTAGATLGSFPLSLFGFLLRACKSKECKLANQRFAVRRGSGPVNWLGTGPMTIDFDFTWTAHGSTGARE